MTNLTRFCGPAILVLLLSVMVACVKKETEKYAKVPHLEYKSVNMHSINLSVDTGEWMMFFDFVDGDGDLGTRANDNEMRIFLKNEVLDKVYEFPFPYIPPSARSGKSYLKGASKAVLDIQAFFRMRDDIPDRDKDTFVFSLYIVDEAGNQSNTLISDSIYIVQQ
ncbi:MAG TPA: hypothetical protein VKZ76_06890 [Edaphocola sp.]|nr:hypothetical protein [Edaphocola sp.]